MVLVKRLVSFGASAVIIAIASFSECGANYTSRVEVKTAAGRGPAVLMINDRPAVRFLVSNGRLSPTERANISAARIRNLIAANTDWKTIRTRRGQTGILITAGDKPICVVTPQDARANKSDAAALARDWARRLSWLLRMPPITVSPAEVLVPLSETRTVQIGGAGIGPVTCISEDPKVASCELSSDSRYLLVRGHSIGDTRIRLMRQDFTVRLPIRVRKYAARYVGGPPVEVTGELVPAGLLKSLAEKTAERYVQPEPGARLMVGEAKLPESLLARGKSTNAAVIIKAAGENYIPVAFSVSIPIVNVSMLRKPAAALLYSNDPERVTRFGLLYAARIEPDEPARLVYHHQNGMNKRIRMEVSLVNGSDEISKVQIISGIAAPMVDTIAVGYIAGSRFLKDYLNHIGYIAMIPPRSKLVLVDQILSSMETASGVIEFRQLQGHDAVVRVMADLPDNGGAPGGGIAPAPPPEMTGLVSEHIYPTPVRKVAVSYVVGEQWAFIPIGKHAISDKTTGRRLYGNYGVIYEIRVSVENKTGERRKIGILFEPAAGAAAGIFYIDGAFIGRRRVTPPHESLLTSFVLEPGQSRSVLIMTMPLSGSSYPANVLVRAL